MKMRPALAAILAFGVSVALVAVFIVSVVIGGADYIVSCGINPLSLLEPGSNPSASSSSTPTPIATATDTAIPTSAPSVSASQAPVIPSGSLFAAYQAQSGLSAADQAEQRTNAATIVSIGEHRPEHFSARDISVVVAIAIQESNLLNRPYGDLNSLGLFQQRPGEGYGIASNIMDINHSINAVYDRLAGVANRNQLSLIQIAIKIQIPNVADYYARWKWDALAAEIVGIYSSSSTTAVDDQNSCSSAAGVYSSSDVHLPLDPGYVVTGAFGYGNPYPAALKPHKGIDLSGYKGGSRGRPVYAAFAGVVVASGIGKGCVGDNDVTILHAGGFTTGYLHMNGSDILVHIGDHVSAGQRIGSIGACGPEVTGPHLHFEVNPGTDKDAWIQSIPSIQKYGSTWLDPVAFMAHFGVKLVP
jgi:murein DD-endopeptidase MepM/ murein hydrolase activator NlpD